MTSQGFEGASGLVTGAAGQLGGAVARALIDAGAYVTLADLPGERLERLAAELGPTARAVEMNVLVESDVEAAVLAARDFGRGRLDFVFNNAGTEGPIGPIDTLDIDTFARTLAVNVTGAASVLKYALRAVSAGSRIVQTGSTASLAGASNMAPYVASKHAVLGLTRVASREAAARGVRVTALLPGPIEGPMMSRIAQGRSEAGATAPSPVVGVLDGGRLARIDEIVSAALFLLGTESSFVAGAELVVDGGRNA